MVGGNIVGCKDKNHLWHVNGFPNGSSIGSTVYNIGEKPTVVYGHTCSKSIDQLSKVANPAARDQLNRENDYFSVRVRT